MRHEHAIRFWVCLSLLLPATQIVSVAQQSPARQYFPLNVGDTWVYGPNDTLRIVVTESVTLGGKEYFVYNYSYRWGEDPDTLRVDDSGWYVYRYEAGREKILYDFASEEPTYTIEQHGYEYVVTRRTDIDTSTPLRDFADCIEFGFNIPEARDDEWSVWLAPGVGVVEMWGAWQHYSLVSASVGGTLVSVDDVAPGQPRLSTFPNPATDRVIFDFHLPRSGHVRITVLDILGRRVLVPVDGVYESARHRVGADLNGLAAGVYVTLIETYDVLATGSFVVVGPLPDISEHHH